MTGKTILGAVAALLTLPAVAPAHVTIQPREAAAGGYTRLNVRVPNEKDDEGTTKVVVQLPAGFEAPAYEPVAGWDIRTTARTITIAGDGKEGVIAPGQFRDFGFSVKVPEGKAGSKLTFKALQTYAGGEVVRWIGAPDSERPAPQLTLTAAAGGHGAAAGAHRAEATPAAAPATGAATTPAGDDHAERYAVAALVVGGLALLLGGAALLTGRRRPSTA